MFSLTQFGIDDTQ